MPNPAAYDPPWFWLSCNILLLPIFTCKIAKSHLKIVHSNNNHHVSLRLCDSEKSSTQEKVEITGSKGGGYLQDTHRPKEDMTGDR